MKNPSASNPTIKNRIYGGKLIKKIGILIAFLLFIAAPAHSLDIKEHYLPNGLKIITLENHKSPVVTFQVWYKVG